jgi:hypothetical protein
MGRGGAAGRLRDDYLRLVARSAGETSVRRDQRCREGLRERHVQRVPGGEVVAERPHPVEQRVMGMPHEPERTQVVEGLHGPCGRQRAGLLEPAKNLSDLDVDQVGRVEDLTRGEQQIRDPLVRLTPEQEIQCRRRVDDDQRAALAACRASAEVSPSITRDRRSRRSRICSGVGRSAASRSSAMR